MEMTIDEIREAHERGEKLRGKLTGNIYDILFVPDEMALIKDKNGWVGLVCGSEMELAPTPRDDLTAAIEKLMVGVDTKNAVKRTQEKYRLCKEYGEQTGDWVGLGRNMAAANCPLCCAFQHKISICPLGDKLCSGSCIGEFGHFFANPTRATFMRLYDEIMALGKVEVKPGQVWEHKENLRHTVIHKSCGFDGAAWNAINLENGMDEYLDEEYLRRHFTLLPGRRVVTIGKDERVVDAKELADLEACSPYFKMRPEPTLSLDYVRKHVSCAEWVEWFEKCFGEHTTIKSLMHDIAETRLLSWRPFRELIYEALYWLQEHKFVDESLQIIPGSSK